MPAEWMHTSALHENLLVQRFPAWQATDGTTGVLRGKYSFKP
jgi:hypothetical protein